MITLNLGDHRLVENYEAAIHLKGLGLSDEEIQALYDRQLEKDTKDGDANA